jgi:hypothetical protein
MPTTHLAAPSALVLSILLVAACHKAATPSIEPAGPSPEEAATPEPASRPEPVAAKPASIIAVDELPPAESCHRINRLGEPMTAGIRELEHEPQGAGDASDDLEGVRMPFPGTGEAVVAIVPTGRETALPLSRRLEGYSAQAWPERWATDSDAGPVVANPPGSMAGAVTTVLGTSAFGTEKVAVHVAVGPRGARNLRLYRDAYLPKRRAASRPPPAIQLFEIVEHDIDRDGRGDLIFYTIVGDDRGFELGVLTGRGQVAYGDVQTLQGTVFPYLVSVPPALNGGRALLLHTTRCCGGHEVDGYELAGARVTRVAGVSGEGNFAACIEGDAGRPAVVHVMEVAEPD